jgi:UDPglucose 6-dehydrogenase
MEEFNVGVVGAGYVGLVTGACLAHVGHRVVCIDKDGGRVAELREGRMPIYEPDLEELVVQNSRRGDLSFSMDFAQTVCEADVLFIAVDTPQGDDGSADLSSVGTVARSVGRVLAEPGAGGGAGSAP